MADTGWLVGWLCVCVCVWLTPMCVSSVPESGGAGAGSEVTASRRQQRRSDGDAVPVVELLRGQQHYRHGDTHHRASRRRYHTHTHTRRLKLGLVVLKNITRYGRI